MQLAPDTCEALAAALAYARLGWRVHLLPAGQKAPPLTGWQELATTDPAQIERWWTERPDANVAIATGAGSGIVVIDIDNGDAGDFAFAALQDEHGTLPATVEQLTGAGRQLFYAHPGGTIRNRVALATNIDVRGDGGYVVVPPSIHPDGKEYVWEASSDPTDGRALADLPAGWIDLLSVPTEPDQNTQDAPRESAAIPEGQRNAALFKMASSMRSRGFVPDAIDSALIIQNDKCCRPPLAKSEVRRLSASASQYGAGDSTPATDQSPIEFPSLGDIWRDKNTWKPAKYVATGLREFDTASGGGLRARGVHMFVGKPGRAKTQTCIQIAVNAALAGTPVGVVSLEMDGPEVAQLALAQLSRIPRSFIASARLNHADAATCLGVREKHSAIPLTILDDTAWPKGLDRERLAVLVAQGVQRFDWQLVVLDYLSLLAPGELDRSDFQTDLLNSTALRRIARQNNIAMLVVAALRKSANYQDAKKKPITLDDVSGAGRLCYDAVSVWLVDGECTQDSPPCGIVHLVPLKSRYTGAATSGTEVQLRWFPGMGIVENLCEELPHDEEAPF